MALPGNTQRSRRRAAGVRRDGKPTQRSLGASQRHIQQLCPHLDARTALTIGNKLYSERIATGNTSTVTKAEVEALAPPTRPPAPISAPPAPQEDRWTIEECWDEIEDLSPAQIEYRNPRERCPCPCNQLTKIVDANDRTKGLIAGERRLYGARGCVQRHLAAVKKGTSKYPMRKARKDLAVDEGPRIRREQPIDLSPAELRRFEVLFKRHWRWTKRKYASKFGQNVAEDLAQELFIKMLLSEGFRTARDAEAYLRRAQKNHKIDEAKKHENAVSRKGNGDAHDRTIQYQSW